MIRFLLNFMLIIGAAYAITQVVNFYLSLNSGPGQTRKDIAELKSKIATYLARLVPMTNSELELLSVNSDGQSIRRGMTTLKYGAFNSIYHEPLVAYAYKEYKYPADKSLLLVSTDEDDFIYVTQGMQTKVYLNNDELGYVDAKGNMYESESNELLAHIQVDDVISSHPVKIGSREVGEIVNTRLNESPNPRAYQFLEPMNDKEISLFKALTFLSLVEEKVIS